MRVTAYILFVDPPILILGIFLGLLSFGISLLVDWGKFGAAFDCETVVDGLERVVEELFDSWYLGDDGQGYVLSRIRVSYS